MLLCGTIPKSGSLEFQLFGHDCVPDPKRRYILLT